MYQDLFKNFPNSVIETDRRLIKLFKNSFNNNNFIEFGEISKKRKKLNNFEHIFTQVL